MLPPGTGHVRAGEEERGGNREKGKIDKKEGREVDGREGEREYIYIYREREK